MPRTPRQALWLLLGLWLVLSALGPLFAPWAWAQDPGLARLEQQLHLDVNAFRRSRHLVELERRSDLDAVARGHSEDMVRRGFFAHQNPDGELAPDRMARAGVTGFTLAGENSAQTNQPDPNRQVLHGWIASPVHLENLVFAPFHATGVGIARHPDGRLFYTQVYASYPR